MFSLDRLNSLDTLEKRLDYASAELREIGRGSSRAAFDIDGKTVLKMALSKTGITQNRVEATRSETYSKYPVFAKTLSASDDFTWITMELCRTLTESEFDSVLKLPGIGVPLGGFFDEVEGVLRGAAIETDSADSVENAVFRQMGTAVLKQVRKRIRSMEGDPKFSKSAYFLVFSSLLSWIDNEHPDGNTMWDISEISNWGMASRNGWGLPVVVDYGLDQLTARTDYKPDPMAMCFRADDDDE